MLSFVLFFVFFECSLLLVRADLLQSVEYGGKIPSEDQFDVWFKYDADAQRTCEISLKKPSENWKTYAFKTVTCEAGKDRVKALTLIKLEAKETPVGAGYVIEVKLFNSELVQTAYKAWDVQVDAGRQGFHVHDGRVFDANKNEFVMRGVNNPHAWFDSYGRWLAFGALKTIADTRSNTVRIVWEKNGQGLTVSDLDKVIAEAVRNKLVPMIELHDATGSTDAERLREMSRWLADNMEVIIKYRKYIIVNIANEWSPWGTSVEFWRDSWNSAIKILRDAGYSGSIVVDASAYAQNPNGPKLYGQDMLNADQFYNLIFSVHTYAEWATEHANYYIVQEFQEIKNKKIPFIIGEFANTHPARIDGQCKTLRIDAQSIMRECAKHGFGYLGWSWTGNGGGDCGSLSALDIALNWNANSPLTLWGYELINSIGIGIRDSSKVASIF